jgi:toxin HigB-1
MQFEFEDDELRRLATDKSFDMGLEYSVVKAFRMAVQAIDAAPDERLFSARPGWRYEKLKGDLKGRYSIRLNKQWRLLFRYERRANDKLVVIISIVDYH